MHQKYSPRSIPLPSGRGSKMGEEVSITVSFPPGKRIKMSVELLCFFYIFKDLLKKYFRKK